MADMLHRNKIAVAQNTESAQAVFIGGRDVQRREIAMKKPMKNPELPVFAAFDDLLRDLYRKPRR
ncbi:MAG: hypothetical protein AAFV53_13260 [Myxococcota bacterium]